MNERTRAFLRAAVLAVALFLPQTAKAEGETSQGESQGAGANSKNAEQKTTLIITLGLGAGLAVAVLKFLLDWLDERRTRSLEWSPPEGSASGVNGLSQTNNLPRDRRNHRPGGRPG